MSNLKQNTALIIAALTFKETQRRRILWIGLLMGGAFLLLFGLGFHFIYLEFANEISLAGDESEVAFSFLTLAGLYVTNFLIIILSVLISVSAISGEIDTHTIDALITKPIRRWEVVLGKWLGYALMILCGVLLLPGGILLIVYWRAGFVMNNVPAGLLLMYMEGLIVMTLTIAGGTRLSTLANGALAFMLYGLAFIGGWVEQVGALFRNETAVDLGILASLIMPAEVLWRKASTLFQPQIASGIGFAGPFAVSAQPNNLMLGYAGIYILFSLLFALSSFSRRDL